MEQNDTEMAHAVDQKHLKAHLLHHPFCTQFSYARQDAERFCRYILGNPIRNNSFYLKGQCHKDFAVLGQFCAKIITLKALIINKKLL